MRNRTDSLGVAEVSLEGLKHGEGLGPSPTAVMKYWRGERCHVHQDGVHCK